MTRSNRSGPIFLSVLVLNQQALMLRALEWERMGAWLDWMTTKASML